MFVTANLFAQTSTSGTVTGTVTDPSGGLTPSAEVQLVNVGTGAAVSKTPNASGGYTFPNVDPGNYTIIATVEGTPVPMMARQSLQIGSASVDGLRLAPQPGTTVQGRVRVDGKNATTRFDPERIFLALQSVDPEQYEALIASRETFSSIAHVSPDGSFQWTDVPAGNYYVQVMGDSAGNEGWFVKSLTAG